MRLLLRKLLSSAFSVIHPFFMCPCPLTSIPFSVCVTAALVSMFQHSKPALLSNETVWNDQFPSSHASRQLFRLPLHLTFSSATLASVPGDIAKSAGTFEDCVEGSLQPLALAHPCSLSLYPCWPFYQAHLLSISWAINTPSQCPKSFSASLYHLLSLAWPPHLLVASIPIVFFFPSVWLNLLTSECKKSFRLRRPPNIPHISHTPCKA